MQQDPLPGFVPNLASRTLRQLCSQWLSATTELQPGRLTSDAADRTALACLLLAQEERDKLLAEACPELEACLSKAAAGDWPQFDSVIWHIVRDYVNSGSIARVLLDRAQLLLGHNQSGVRQWFHFVAWMIRPDLELVAVRPILLNNLADKLGAVMESAGLLAILYPDKVELDSLADAFRPANDSFVEQYLRRLGDIRAFHWNSNTINFWQAENGCRRLIWDAASTIR